MNLITNWMAQYTWIACAKCWQWQWRKAIEAGFSWEYRRRRYERLQKQPHCRTAKVWSAHTVAVGTLDSCLNISQPARSPLLVGEHRHLYRLAPTLAELTTHGRGAGACFKPRSKVALSKKPFAAFWHTAEGLHADILFELSNKVKVQVQGNLIFNVNHQNKGRFSNELTTKHHILFLNGCSLNLQRRRV